MTAKASTAAPVTVPTMPLSAWVTGVWKILSMKTIVTQANSDSNSVTKPRMKPSAADPPMASRTRISRAVSPMPSPSPPANGDGVDEALPAPQHMVNEAAERAETRELQAALVAAHRRRNQCAIEAE